MKAKEKIGERKTISRRIKEIPITLEERKFITSNFSNHSEHHMIMYQIG